MFRIIHLAISPEEMTARLEKRANFDDKQEAIQKRLAIYRTKTVPVLEKYTNKVVHVSISGITKSDLHTVD
jgi:adenylate kinase family enzyme